MGAEADTNNKTTAAEAAGADEKVSDGVEKKMSMGSEKSTKPVGGGKLKTSGLNGVLTDDDIATTLAAASEKLQASHRQEQKKRQKSGLSRFLGALNPKKVFSKFRDCYIDSCVMAAEKGDFVDLVAGHPGMYYGDSIMSRNISQRRDREHEEMMQASLNRQASVSLSRQQSTQSQSGSLRMSRNTSTGNSGLNRKASTGISGFSRNPSTGMSGFSRQGSTAARNSSSKKYRDSNLFSAGRNTYMQQINPAALDQNKTVLLETV